MRERARAASARADAEPGVARTARTCTFNNINIRDILDVLGDATGINITYDRDGADDAGRRVNLDGVTLEQALKQIMTMNQLVVQGSERAVDLRVSGHARRSTRSTTSR